MSALARPHGFDDASRGSQSVFRAAMDAMARPGTIGRLRNRLTVPPPLSAEAAALALTLCDYETPLWIDEALASAPEVADYLRFHTGAAIVGAQRDAAFALVSDPSGLPDLGSFGLGALDYPDRSTTLIVQVQRLDDRFGWRLTGPGIAGQARLWVEPMPPHFVAQRQALGLLFPRGMDIFFVAEARLAGLPRTTRVEA